MSGSKFLADDLEDTDAEMAIEFIEDAVMACRGQCPDCGGELDTGWQCECGGDFRDVVMSLNDDVYVLLSRGA